MRVMMARDNTARFHTESDTDSHTDTEFDILPAAVILQQAG